MTTIPFTSLDAARRQARRLKDSLPSDVAGIALTQCQYIVAVAAGYRDWADLKKVTTALHSLSPRTEDLVLRHRERLASTLVDVIGIPREVSDRISGTVIADMPEDVVVDGIRLPDFVLAPARIGPDVEVDRAHVGTNLTLACATFLVCALGYAMALTMATRFSIWLGAGFLIVTSFVWGAIFNNGSRKEVMVASLVSAPLIVILALFFWLLIPGPASLFNFFADRTMYLFGAVILLIVACAAMRDILLVAMDDSLPSPLRGQSFRSMVVEGREMRVETTEGSYRTVPLIDVSAVYFVPLPGMSGRFYDMVLVIDGKETPERLELTGLSHHETQSVAAFFRDKVYLKDVGYTDRYMISFPAEGFLSELTLPVALTFMVVGPFLAATLWKAFSLLPSGIPPFWTFLAALVAAGALVIALIATIVVVTVASYRTATEASRSLSALLCTAGVMPLLMYASGVALPVPFETLSRDYGILGALILTFVAARLLSGCMMGRFDKRIERGEPLAV